MASTYRLTSVRRVVNRISRTFTSAGIGPKTYYLLTVTGRTSGIPRSTPVVLVEKGGARWLVAPYGEVGWVKNVRAAGQVTLSHGRRSETAAVAELGPVESAPVLKAYITKVAVTRPFFDVRHDSPLEAFEAEAPRHPVFLIRPKAEAAS